tara:strand:- start:10204 stop:10527 length:324 start_codon:yes stop_codon:yes gene_type:complete
LGLTKQKDKQTMTINKAKLKKIIKEQLARTLHEEEYDDPSELGVIDDFKSFAREYNEDPSQYTTEQLDGVVSLAVDDVLSELRTVASSIGVRGDDFKQRVAAALAEL